MRRTPLPGKIPTRLLLEEWVAQFPLPVRQLRREEMRADPEDGARQVIAIKLTMGVEAMIDIEDSLIISGRNWFAVKSRGQFYAHCRMGTFQVSMHRLILGFPDGLADHKNGNGLDNRRSNIRIASSAQNARNQRKRAGVSKYKGVAYGDNAWIAGIYVDNRRMHLGCFQNERDAAEAYNTAAKKYYGEFARLNTL